MLNRHARGVVAPAAVLAALLAGLLTLQLARQGAAVHARQATAPAGQPTPPAPPPTPGTPTAPAGDPTQPQTPGTPAQPAVPTPAQEIQPLLRLIDEYAGGAAAPRDFTMSLRTDYFKGAALKTYAPYTVALDASAIDAPSLMLYLRVVQHAPETTAAEPEPEPEAALTGPVSPTPQPPPAFEDAHFVDADVASDGGSIRISGAFAVAPGDYDVYVALRERGVSEDISTSVLEQRVTVPDFFGDRLTTSSVMRIERLGVHPAPLSEAELRARPYTLGTMELVPAWRSSYATSDALSTLFIVYNPSVAADTGKPDVTVEYDFYRTDGDEETFFNRTPRQHFDAETLPPAFDLALGHQLVAERTVPLQAFPAGDYRIEIRVTDRVSGQALERDVAFTVESP